MSELLTVRDAKALFRALLNKVSGYCMRSKGWPIAKMVEDKGHAGQVAK